MPKERQVETETAVQKWFLDFFFILLKAENRAITFGSTILDIITMLYKIYTEVCPPAFGLKLYS